MQKNAISIFIFCFICLLVHIPLIVTHVSNTCSRLYMKSHSDIIHLIMVFSFPKPPDVLHENFDQMDAAYRFHEVSIKANLRIINILYFSLI